MNITEMFKSPYKLRWYFAVLVSSAILLSIVNYYFIPNHLSKSVLYYEAVTSFFNNLISLIFSSIVASLAVLFFTPKIMRNSEINLIEPRNLSFALNDSIRNTANYAYVGHTARWNRSNTFEVLKNEAKQSHTRKQISIIILDPRNAKTCEYFSNFGHSNRKNSQIESEKDVIKELLATILICAEYNNAGLLDFELRLTDKVSLFRLDISDNAIIMTKPYSNEPALNFPCNTFFYESYKEEYKIIKDQSALINLKPLPRSLDYISCKTYLSDIDINIQNLDENDYKDIVNKFKNPKNPY